MTPLQLELTRLIGKKEYVLCSQWIEIFRTKNKEEAEKIMNDWNEKYEKYIDSLEWWTPIVDNRIDISEEDIPATLSDLHRWMSNNRGFYWEHNWEWIKIVNYGWDGKNIVITYDAEEDLLDQSEETLKQIVELIKSNQ